MMQLYAVGPRMSQRNATTVGLMYLKDRLASAVAKATAAVKADSPKLLPIGEGAYQSHEAVKQRTTNSSRACEEGKWEDCLHKDGGDLLDGHSYGPLAPPPKPAPPVRAAAHAGSSVAWLAVAVVATHLAM